MKNQNKIKPILNKDMGFKVPEGYFNELPNAIINKINSPEINKPKTILLSKRILSYAASFIGFLIILFIGYNYFFTQTYEITPDEMVNYIESNSYSYHENEIADMIDYEYSAENSTLELNSDDVIEYLLAEEIDYYTIINEMY